MSVALWLSVLGSTLSWAAFDGVRKKLVTKVPVAALAFWIAVAQVPGYLLWAVLGGNFEIGAGYLLPAAGSVVLNLLSNVLFLESVRRGPLSVAIPVLSFTPVFAALGSIPLLGEHLVLTQWLGVCGVSVAALFLTAAPGEATSPLRLVATFFRSPGVLHMFGVAILWSISPLLDKLALEHAAVGVHGSFLALFMALGMAVYLAAVGRRGELALPSGAFGLLALGGLTNVVALGLQLVSITQMVVSVFEAFKRAAGVLIALAMGAFLFKEEITRTRAISAGLMAAGVVLVLRG